MGWTKAGYVVTVDWHVMAGGRWRVESQEIGRPAPVNVYVTPERMAPVQYRHQASECRGECALVCGHALTYGCDCDTIAVEADGQGDTGHTCMDHDDPFNGGELDFHGCRS